VDNVFCTEKKLFDRQVIKVEGEDTNMNRQVESKFANASLIAITLTATITAVHHVYRLGFPVLIPFIVVIALPYLAMRWVRQTNKKAARWAYGVINVLILLWFGFIDGFLDHVMKLLGFQHTTFLPGGQAAVVQTALSLWSPEAGNAFYEGTGILTFIVSVVALYFLFRFVQNQRSSATHNHTVVSPSA
jgi:hypothetical protein